MLPVQVTLYTRQNCSLCDRARETIRSSGTAVVIEEIDIDGDPALIARYTNDVPVILVDGVEAFRHRLDRDAFVAYVRDPQRVPGSPLARENCVPCRGGVPPLRGEELQTLAAQVGAGWRVMEEHHLEKMFRFPDFATALAFTNRVGSIAEEQGHHPDVHLRWGEVRLEIWTHSIDGLTRSDFVLAAKIG